MLIMKKSERKSRGTRNKNPFNMNRGALWFGEINGTDERFASFKTMDLGVRAGLINLYNGYFSRCLTIEKIVMKYSPGSDNITKTDPDGMKQVKAYANAIYKRSGVAPGDVPEKKKWLAVAEAILFHENGAVVYNVSELLRVVNLYSLRNYL